VKPT